MRRQLLLIAIVMGFATACSPAPIRNVRQACRPVRAGPVMSKAVPGSIASLYRQCRTAMFVAPGMRLAAP